MTEIARGLAGIVLTETRLSRIDGEAGELIIGGFALEDLAPYAEYEEVLFLLWNDRLPTRSELDEFKLELASMRQLGSATLNLLRQVAERGLRVALAREHPLLVVARRAGNARLRRRRRLLALGRQHVRRNVVQNEFAEAD